MMIRNNHIDTVSYSLYNIVRANAEFNDGMLVDPSKLNFKFNYGKSYVIFACFAFVCVMFLITLTHAMFEKIDFHFSILFTIIATSAVFIGFDCFKAWARKKLTHELIKRAWANHFLYFPYEKYSRIVENIYNEALKNDVPRRELEQYVLSKIVEVGEK
ncbi:MAG: hypothetical protein ACFNVQ_04100 [Campylobacter sp.]